MSVLSQDDRRQFNAIAQQLAADPDFVRRTRSHPVQDRPVPTVMVLSAILYVAVPVLMILGGWTAALPAVGLYAVAVAVVLLRRRRAVRQGRRPRH